MPFNFSSLRAIAQECQQTTSTKTMSDLNHPSLTYEQFAYPYSYEDLPTVYTSSKYIFPVLEFGLNPHQVSFENNTNNILKMPFYETSYLSKNWAKIQAEKENKSLLDYRLSIDDKFKAFITDSVAPYGYEFEEMFLDQDSIQHVAHTDRDTSATATFMNFTIKPESSYEDDRLISHTAFKVSCSYEKKTNTLFTKLVKSSRIQYKFWKESKSLVKVLGLKGNLCFKDGPLPYFMTRRLEVYAEEHYKNVLYLLSKKPYPFYSVYRKIFKNPMWKDLNSPFAAYYIDTKSRHYNRIRYHYHKHGTKGARHALYKTKNKALIKEYENTDPRLVSNLIETTSALINVYKYTEEKCLSTIQKTKEVASKVPSTGYGSTCFSSIYSERFFNLVYYLNKTYKEITLTKIFGLLCEGNYTFSEVLRELGDIQRSIMSLNTLKTEHPDMYANQVLPQCDKKLNLHKLSTDLGQMVARHRDRESFIPYPHYDEYAEFYNFEDDLYTYSFVNNTSELKDCGNSLNICVGSYGSRVKSKQSDIIFVREKSNPSEFYACVEVNPIQSGTDFQKTMRRLSQVKLRRNAGGRTIPELNKAILEWCKERDINFENCYDITQPEPERMVTQTFTYNRYEDDRRNANAGGIANGW